MGKKLKDFCHPREYIPNNIYFRIVSSEAQTRFKLMQSLTLKEIVQQSCTIPFYWKELVLFNYDVWFNFILNLEYYFLKTDKLSMEFIEDMIEETISYKEETFAKQYQSSDLIIYFHIIRSLFKLLKNYIISLNFSKNEYGHFVDIISNLLREAFYIIIEINSFENNENKIFVTEFGLNLKDNYLDMIKFKINIYKKYFNFNKVYIHNLSKKEIIPDIKIDYELINI